MTIQDLSNYLAVSVSTLRKWRMQGDGPPALIVGRHRWRREDVMSWLDQ